MDLAPILDPLLGSLLGLLTPYMGTIAVVLLAAAAVAAVFGYIVNVLFTAHWEDAEENHDGPQ